MLLFVFFSAFNFYFTRVGVSALGEKVPSKCKFFYFANTKHFLKSKKNPLVNLSNKIVTLITTKYSLIILPSNFFCFNQKFFFNYKIKLKLFEKYTCNTQILV